MLVLRRDVGMLLSEGQPMAMHYPLWRLQLESSLARERRDQDIALSSSMIQSAINGCFNKKAAKEFTENLKKLTHGE
tara:strand:+ start:3120 stop:3350 length:231 start_codon:yes stop_codon:yes gene_type:complete